MKQQCLLRYNLNQTPTNPAATLLEHTDYPHRQKPHLSCAPLSGSRKANGRVAEIIDRVPLPEESITENGERTNGFGEVHAHEGRDTRTLDLENIVIRTDGEVVTGERKGEVGQTVALVALNCVLAVEALLGTNLFVAGRC